jgi:hypothetical protein
MGCLIAIVLGVAGTSEIKRWIKNIYSECVAKVFIMEDVLLSLSREALRYKSCCTAFHYGLST